MNQLYPPDFSSSQKIYISPQISYKKKDPCNSNQKAKKKNEESKKVSTQYDSQQESNLETFEIIRSSKNFKVNQPNNNNNLNKKKKKKRSKAIQPSLEQNMTSKLNSFIRNIHQEEGHDDFQPISKAYSQKQSFPQDKAPANKSSMFGKQKDSVYVKKKVQKDEALVEFSEPSIDKQISMKEDFEQIMPKVSQRQLSHCNTKDTQNK